MGVPNRYITTLSGRQPYNRKVKMAPKTVPCADKASAKAIISTT